MSAGRHARPRARAGGLLTVLALVVAVGAVALALSSAEVRALRLGLASLAAFTAVLLLVLARDQRVTARALVRTEDRVRTLEQRARDEGDDLHRRVIASVTREGELRVAVEILATEISRLRTALDGFAPTIESLAVPTPVVDLPLLQRVFAEPVAPSRSAGRSGGWSVRATSVETARETAPRHADTSSAPAARREPEPAPPAGTTWVVREIEVGEPFPQRAPAEVVDLTPRREASNPWTSVARPA
jgi:hypothetical protein